MTKHDSTLDGATMLPLREFDQPVAREDWRIILATLGAIWSGVIIGVAGTLMFAGVM